MTAPLSQDLRARIVRAVQKGSSTRQAAARYEVSPSAAVKLLRRVRETGSSAPARIGGHRRRILEPHQDLLRALVEAKPEITLAEIRAVLQSRGIVVRALSTLHDMLKRMKLTRKKDAARGRAGAPRCRARAPPLADLAALHGHDLLRIPRRDRRHDQPDAPLRALSARRAPGERHALGHWQTTTFVAGLRSSGLIAPLVLDGPMTGAMVRASVTQMLCPGLAPGDVVVMDNLSAHKVAGVTEAIRAVGASVLDLPPYSPDLNPIEQVYAKLKALLRKAAARTKEALWKTIGDLLEAFQADECQNYLTNCGYEPV
jgi:transposase